MMTELPRIEGGWKCVVADPPWKFSSNSKARPGRNAMRHYDCMTLAEIEAMPVRDVVADNAVLFFWITSPLLVIGAHIPIMRAWGFKPTALAFSWLKLNKNAPTLFHSPSDYFVGPGHTTRKNGEFVVLGKRGRSLRQSKSVREPIIAPVRRHSEKPEEFYDRVVAYAPGPRLELFGRRSREGWEVWGNESTKFDSERAQIGIGSSAISPPPPDPPAEGRGAGICENLG